MRVVLMTGSHPRHLHLARTLHAAGLLHALLIEQREEFVPQPPGGLAEVDRRNFIRHFHDRGEAERRFFGAADSAGLEARIPLLRIRADELNGEPVGDWLLRQKADAVVTFGVHLIGERLLRQLPAHAWNLHGGLSPWYRGNITLFWPFYFLQPNWAGVTIHELTSRLDGGDVVHHSVPELKRGDGIHDVACRAIVQAADDLARLLEQMRQGRPVSSVPQKSSGKLFNAKDWTPQHLRLIYQTFDNDIVDRYLDGVLGHREPPLVRAF